jgi:peroxiredoxin
MARTFLWLFLLPALVAQEPAAPKRSLTDLQRAFAEQTRTLNSGEQTPSREARLALLHRQIKELDQFLAQEAKGDDKSNGRLMLADLWMGAGEPETAAKALEAMPEDAPGMALLTAAVFAEQIGKPDLQGKLIDRALAQDAPLPDRMAMARLLMTRLRQVDRGEKIFSDALAAAKDDAGRAEVRWYRAQALRDREDLPENASFDALEALAKDLPDTYYGSVAKDWVKAAQFKVGAEPVLFSAQTTDGKAVSLADQHGKVVVLAFWSADQPDAADLVVAVQALRKTHSADDLFVLGISVDASSTEFAAACKRLGADFPQVCDGHGMQADLALRYHVETVPTLFVIGRDGKLAGINLRPGASGAEQALDDVVTKALGKQS